MAEFVVQTLEERLRGQPTADELPTPFRRQVEQSGVSDDDLAVFFEEVREEVWQEKHGQRE